MTRVPFFLKINPRNSKGRWYYRQVIISDSDSLGAQVKFRIDQGVMELASHVGNSDNGRIGGHFVPDLTVSFKTIENEDDKRLTDLKKKQKKSHWLQKIAAERSGLNYKQLLRWDNRLDAERSPSILKRSTANKLTPELRWALAYRIRRSNTIFDAGVTKSLVQAAGILNPGAVRVYTATTEDVYATEEEEVKWLRKASPTVSWEVRPEFTGGLDVIIDMESDAPVDDEVVDGDAHAGFDSQVMVLDGKGYGKLRPGELELFDEGYDGNVLIEAVVDGGAGASYTSCMFESADVARMLDFLERSKACRLFNEVDGRSARYRWEVDHWEAIRYPHVASLYEKNKMKRIMDRKTVDLGIDGFSSLTNYMNSQHPQILP